MCRGGEGAPEGPLCDPGSPDLSYSTGREGESSAGIINEMGKKN